jgi:hypothetical protein
MGQFGCSTRILRVIHGRDARATFQTDALPADAKYVKTSRTDDIFLAIIERAAPKLALTKGSSEQVAERPR